MSLTRQMEEATIATADLVRRSGATAFECGYLYDVPRVEDQGWYASAYFGERQIRVDGRNPIDACMALALELLDNTLCRRCGRPITVFGTDGGGFCVWSLRGAHWHSGCGLPLDWEIPLVSKADG